jgi:hypothetical protein
MSSLDTGEVNIPGKMWLVPVYLVTGVRQVKPLARPGWS